MKILDRVFRMLGVPQGRIPDGTTSGAARGDIIQVPRRREPMRVISTTSQFGYSPSLICTYALPADNIRHRGAILSIIDGDDITVTFKATW